MDPNLIGILLKKICIDIVGQANHMGVRVVREELKKEFKYSREMPPSSLEGFRKERIAKNRAAKRTRKWPNGETVDWTGEFSNFLSFSFNFIFFLLIISLPPFWSDNRGRTGDALWKVPEISTTSLKILVIKRKVVKRTWKNLSPKGSFWPKISSKILKESVDLFRPLQKNSGKFHWPGAFGNRENSLGNFRQNWKRFWKGLKGADEFEERRLILNGCQFFTRIVVGRPFLGVRKGFLGDGDLFEFFLGLNKFLVFGKLWFQGVLLTSALF